MAMGSSLSRILSNLFMEYFETQILPTITHIEWLRYVEDILVFIDNDEVFNTFFDVLNNVHPDIKFKLDMEDDNRCLPFLDLLIHRQDSGNLK